MDKRDVENRAELLQSIAVEHGARSFEWRTSLEDREQLWSGRHNAYFASRALRPGAEVLTTDVCVPIARLAECIALTREDLAHFRFPPQSLVTWETEILMSTVSSTPITRWKWRRPADSPSKL